MLTKIQTILIILLKSKPEMSLTISDAILRMKIMAEQKHVGWARREQLRPKKFIYS